MYSSFLSTHRCIRVLHCSKQCYSSSTPRPFSSCAVFAFTSSTDGKWVPFSTLFTLVYRKKSHRVLNPWIWRMFKYSNVFIGKKLLEQKGIVSWGIVLMQHPDFVLPEIRLLPPQGLLHCLSVNTNHVCNHSHAQTSNFASNFTGFLNVLVGFQSQRVTWIVDHLPLLPDPH